MSVLVMDEQHLLLSVASSDAATRDRLMATVHLIGPVDRHRCPVHVADLDPPTTTRTGSDLVPEDPDAITVCAYTDGWIRDSRVRSGADLRSLADALNALPPGASHDPLNSGPRCQEPREGLVLHLTYPDRVLDEVARIHTCGDFFIGDQHGRSQVTFDITRELIDGLVYDGSFPSPGVLQPE